MCINICPNNKEKKSQLDRKRNHFNLSEDSSKESNENKKLRFFRIIFPLRILCKMLPHHLFIQKKINIREPKPMVYLRYETYPQKHDNLIPSDLNRTIVKYYIMLPAILVYNRKITIRQWVWEENGNVNLI